MCYNFCYFEDLVVVVVLLRWFLTRISSLILPPIVRISSLYRCWQSVILAIKTDRYHRHSLYTGDADCFTTLNRPKHKLNFSSHGHKKDLKLPYSTKDTEQSPALMATKQHNKKKHSQQQHLPYCPASFHHLCVNGRGHTGLWSLGRWYFNPKFEKFA